MKKGREGERNVPSFVRTPRDCCGRPDALTPPFTLGTVASD